MLAAAGFAIFCLITSGVYIVNDIMDRERDRAHPEKKHRPLASGRLSVSTAAAAAVGSRGRGPGGGVRAAAASSASGVSPTRC